MTFMLLSNRNKWPFDETLALSACALIIISFTGATYARNILWRDEVSLYLDVSEKSPHKARGHVGLVMAHESSDLTIERYQTALKLNPNYAEAHNNLAIAYKRRGLFEKATEQYREALRLDPNRAEIYNNLGNAYDSLGLLDKAMECYESAIKIKPDYAVAHYNLGIAYEHKGLIDKAIEQYQIAVKIRPTFIVAKERLSMHALRHSKQN